MSAKRRRDLDTPDGDNKRIRSNNGSPVPAAAVDTSDDAKQQAAARVAALKAKMAALKSNASKPAAQSEQQTPTPASKENGNPARDSRQAEVLRKIAEFKAARAKTSIQSPTPAVQQHETPINDHRARIIEASAKAADLAKRRAENVDAALSAERGDGRAARGGLGIGLHPSLISQQAPSASSRKEQEQGRPAEKKDVNPYLAGAEADSDVEDEDTSFDTTIAARAKQRKSKPLAFVPQGKYIAQAVALKEQAKLEDLKRRIALESKKVAIEQASDKSFLVAEPPVVEWWDESLLSTDHKTYDDWQKHNRIESADSIVTSYVQHPVLMMAPQDKNAPVPKPLMLTGKEQKKLRRQRRMADMKEEQAKVRLGLKEPAPPKVKKSNMMVVYGEQAVKDPTAVEARVNREIAQRLYDHEQANDERKLSKEDRAEKLKKQQEGDAAKGIRIAVFRVDSLSSGKHRYQVDVNAKQNALTGVVVLHPDMNLVVVEGGVHSVNNYKNLMLKRIKWTENALSLVDNANSTFAHAASRNTNRDLEEGPNAIDTWLNPLTEHGEAKDLSENKCLLVWEGDERQRAFRKWGSRVCNTDGEARDMLARSKMENMWALAKGMSA